MSFKEKPKIKTELLNECVKPDSEIHELKNWVETYQRQIGREIKTLHIGNIGNNAYRTATLLKKIGIKSDVVCYDYSHAMSTPEWEDALIEGEVGDPFYPDWVNAEIKDFERPDWFVQGPLIMCINYLIHKNESKLEESDSFLAKTWTDLGIANKTQQKIELPLKNRWLINAFEHVKAIVTTIVNTFNKHLLGSIRYCFRIARKALHITSIFCGKIFSIFFSKDSVFAINPFRYVIKFLDYIEATLRLMKHKIHMLVFSVLHAEQVLQAEQSTGKFLSQEVKIKLIQEFDQKFPDRLDRLTMSDFIGYTMIPYYWARVLGYYDIVHGYSVDPIIPMLCEVPYFCLEHGTLRDIPFEDSPQGRLTALAYSKGVHSFVTNFDCIPSAKRLCPNSFTYINHPFDEHCCVGLEGHESIRENLIAELQVDFIVFSPTRHDWVEGKGFNDKANNFLINAVGRLSQEGFRIGLVLCAWGHNVEESKKLIEGHGFQSRVKWIKPISTRAYRLLIKASDVVADQFKLGAFGGIFINAMCARKPILAFLDEEQMLEIYNIMPPVLNCNSEQGIYLILKSILEGEVNEQEIQDASSDWMNAEHSWKQSIGTIANQYKVFLENSSISTAN